MKNKIVFITGGARSGKSSFALREAEKIDGRKAYIATAQALDDEMKERIRKHKDERGAEWDTFEEPFKIPEIISDADTKYSVVVLDCLTLWLSNLICGNMDCSREIDGLIAVLEDLMKKANNSKLFIVSNEVGMGIVPENELARRFRDTAGFLNQKVAEIADEVYLVTAGIPIKIK
ncbi:MAG: bifunctional adenosylcobinamide kinase/adenosylcobinamide-phosphate guanylyltransferase [Thermodesulfovibrionia bacterium]|nr:bifunctional adenosylcobinamide kinase/adenosylcobinamide-phosphate guanylyltransferase [Thermodesulfovibrionia bacterium]